MVCRRWNCFQLLSPFCEKVFISARPEQNYFDLPKINDLTNYNHKGPLGGILSSMHIHPGVAWCVLACDLPNITQETIKYLIEHRDVQKTATAFISSFDGLPEPLCAIWEAHSREAIVQLFESGIQCPRKILIKSNVKLVHSPVNNWLDNFNSPHDLLNHSKETLS